MIKKENLIRMAEIRGEWCVSLYMPINEKSVKEKRRKLKKLIFEAELQLSNLGVESYKIARTLGPVEMIQENPGFWENPMAGIAAFFTPESFAWYSMQYPFDDLVVVTDRFHLKPLLRNTSENGRFYLLALSPEQIKLFEASELGINEVYVKGIPRNPSCFFDPEQEENSLGEDSERERLLDLFRRVDKAVAEFLKTDNAPLVLAGDEHLHQLYHDANSYPHFVKIGIGSCADQMVPKQLLDRALPIVKPVFRRRQEKALRRFEEKLGSGQASNNLAKIFAAAKNGRIETLFVPAGRQNWGTFDHETGELFLHKNAKPGDKDLLCVASSRTLRTGGDVFVLQPDQMPGNSMIAAVLRS